MIAEFALLTIAAYLLGSIPAAYLAAKFSRGIDLRQYGSGNVGATNLLRLTSKRVAIPVFIFDLGKGMAIVWVAHLVGLSLPQQIVVGLLAIIGHNWPVFLRFTGGRGIMTTIGVGSILPLINGVEPWAMVVFGAIAISGAILRNTPLRVFVGLAALPPASWGFGDPLPITLGYLAMFLLVIIRRLAVPRADIAASLSTRELLLNRLLFDRDIRDREAWMSRLSRQQEEQGKG